MDQGIKQIEASQEEAQELQRRRAEAMKTKLCFGKTGAPTWGLNVDCWTCILKDECKACPWLSENQTYSAQNRAAPRDGIIKSAAFQNAVAASNYSEAWKLLDVEDHAGRSRRRLLHI